MPRFLPLKSSTYLPFGSIPMNKCPERTVTCSRRVLLAIALTVVLAACGGGGGEPPPPPPPPRFESISVGGTAAVRDNVTGIVWAASLGNTGLPAGATEPKAAELWRLTDLSADTLRPYFDLVLDATPLIKTKEEVLGVGGRLWAVDFGQTNEQALGSLGDENSSDVLVKSLFVLSRRSEISSVTYPQQADPNGTVTAAGLTWKVCSEGRSLSGAGCTGTATLVAASGAQALAAAANTNGFAGGAGWRVPTKQELRSLLQLENDVSQGTLLPAVFDAPTLPQYWSSGRSSDGNSGWLVDFSGQPDIGGVELAPIVNLAYVRLVRNAP
jgi:hypothetical protein